ncbi:TMV resistance protein N [Morella rubra]|uniref:TMV resistance protein N n=1 Tax=Morella rubra TaxID=262757 RepID=A0A6A1VGA4_9ROSI|nr:TMV resistance protein N [Morella rubra]
MKRLRVFINHNARFSGGPKCLSNELRVLDWAHYPLQSLPSNFSGNKLVVFRMHNNPFKEMGGGRFQNMTIIDFSGSKFLTKIPDLSRSPNLKEVVLKSCTNLVEVHHSVGFLDKLVTLNCWIVLNLRAFQKALS